MQNYGFGCRTTFIIHRIIKTVGKPARLQILLAIGERQACVCHCPKCNRVVIHTRQDVENLGTEAEIIKIKDCNQNLEYPILSTPGLALTDKLVCSGRIPSQAEISNWLAELFPYARPTSLLN